MNILDKNSEKVLELILLNYDSSQSNTVVFSKCRCFDEYAPSVLDDILKNLSDERYIAYYAHFEEPYGALPLNKGITYFECKRNNNLRSFFKPIVITVLANIILDALRWLLLYLLK